MALKSSAVARQASSPAQTGNLGPMDIAHVAYTAGFRGDKLTTAVAVALAESSGNPKNVSPTQDYGLWQINKPAHPQYFKQANRIFDPVYNATAAFAISGGGSNWTPWTTFKSGAYKHYMGQGIPTGPGADKIIGSGAGSGGGWNPIGGLENALNPVKWVDEAAKAVVAFLKIMVDPEELGRHIANVLLWLLKQFTKGFYNIIVIPPWRWSQRATVYYYRNVINEGGSTVIGAKAIATMSFWAVGYAILWGRFEPAELRGVTPADSALAGTLNMGRNAVVSRRITKPKDVDKATAKKPKPTATTIPVTKVRAVAASRRRAVKVMPASRVTDEVGNVVDKELRQDIELLTKEKKDERHSGHRRREEGQQQQEGDQEVVHETSDTEA